jgi:DNA repair photolyase
MIRALFGKFLTGVAQWARYSYNFGIGCSHDCVYCYARGCALRFKRVENRSAWSKEVIKESMPEVRKFRGLVMFPSAHDISPFYLPTAVTQLKALLECGNKVLIVSKPHLECISTLCSEFPSYKSQITFRFTISTFDRKITKLWERGAPEPRERFACLQHAFRQGFTTSVSMEPMLGGAQDALATFHKLVPYVTETIWLGKMNHINRWGPATAEVSAACWYIRKMQSDEAILHLVHRLRHHPQVQWKDSIQEVLRNRESSSAR